MNPYIAVPLFSLFAYLLGSISPSLLITRLVKGVDVREAGSFHATTTNTIRQVGWGAGVFVAFLDVLKGFIPTYLAIRYTSLEWLPPLIAALAVIGHCWPIFSGFRGGMGLGTAGGALIAVYPLGFFIGIGVLIALALLLRHSARAGLLTGLLIAPIFWLFGQRGQVIWLTAIVGAILAVRFIHNWNRQYRELWLDREQEPQ